MGRRIAILATLLLALTQVGCLMGYGTMSPRLLAGLEAMPPEQLQEIEGSYLAFEGSVLAVFPSQGGRTVQIMVQEYRGAGEYGPTLMGRVPPGLSIPIVPGEHIAMLGFLDNRVSGVTMFGVQMSALSLRVIAIDGEYQSAWLLSETVAFNRWKAGTLFNSAARNYGR